MITESYVPSANPGKLPPVVLLPGLGLSSWYLKRLAAALARTTGVWTISTGSGRDAAGTVAQIALTVCEWLKMRNRGPVILLGHSFGAQICAAVAVRAPGLVRGIVLVSPTVDAAARSFGGQAWRFICDVPLESPGLVCYAALRFVTHPLRLVREARAALKFPLETALPAIGVRALVIRGERDRVVSSEWAGVVTGLLPRARLVTIPGEAHGIVYTAPEEVAAAVRHFAEGGECDPGKKSPE